MGVFHRRAIAAFGHCPPRALFPLRLQHFNRLGLCNPLGENQPSLSRRCKLFAMSPVAYGLSHFAVGDFQAFGHSQYLPVQPLTDQRAVCRRAISHRTRSLGGIIGVTIGYERRGCEKWDIRAPAPVLGQDVAKYRRDLAVKLKRQLPDGHELRQVQYRALNDSALDALEPQLYQAVSAEAHNPNTVPPGEFRKVIEVDQGGTRITKFIGQQSFVKEFTRPGRRVVSFMHAYDASGRPLR